MAKFPLYALSGYNKALGIFYKLFVAGKAMGINMTSKERANLRAQANSLEALFQVGKGGISDALIKQTDDALTARELIKIKVLLETAPEKPKEIAQKLAEATNSECVGVIGGSMIFYRYNPELHKDEKKKAKNKGRK